MKKVIASKQIPCMTLPQVEKMIAFTEKNVADGTILMQKLKDPMDEAYQMYLDEKGKYDAVKSELENDESLLLTLVHMRNGTSSKNIGDVRVLRTTSNLDKKPKTEKTKSKISWKEIITHKLENADRFLKQDDLISIIMSDKNLVEEFGIKKSVIYPALSYLLKDKKKNLAEIKLYKDKFGLPSWFDVDVPKVEYMKDFMFKD